MKILSLRADNFKRLQVVEINPDGNLVRITGKNGQGKSSVLDAIEAVLGGGRALPPRPVRKGAKHAKIIADLGSLVVSRRFTADGATSLQVESADGSVLNSPQRVLDELFARFSFDPIALLRMDGKKQLETLRSVVKVDVDLEQLDGRNTRDYNARTDLNRDAKQLRARIAAMDVPDLPVGASPKEVDTADILSRIEGAAAANAEVEQRKVRREQVAEGIARRRAKNAEVLHQVLQLRSQIESLEAAIETNESEAVSMQAKLDEAEALPELVDVTALRVQLDNGTAINKAIERRRERDRLVAEADGIEKQAAALTDAIDERTRQKAEAIANAKMPVAGLSFNDEGVLLNGFPFEQASSAEQLRASMAIAMAMNPELRVVLIRDGSLLDEDGLRLVAELATEKDFQVWVESVDSSGAVGFVMEDGRVKGAADAE